MAPKMHARQQFWFQFLTTPTADTPGTVLILHFDKQRYIFGRVAEGTQRACIQRGVGLKKLQNIFLTGTNDWAHNGGVLGMLLTIADVHASAQLSNEESLDRPRLHIHGSPKLAHTFASARRFIFRTGMPLSVYEHEPKEASSSSSPIWEDEQVRVWALPARRFAISAEDKKVSTDSESETGDREENEADRKTPKAKVLTAQQLAENQRLRHQIVHDMFDSDWRLDKLVETRFDEVKLPARVFLRDPETKQLNSFNCASMSDAPHIAPDTKVQVRQPWPASRTAELPSAKRLPDVAMSYIIRGHPQRGSFDMEKVKALGIKPGPIFRELSIGESVKLDDGRVITPDMVLTPTKPGKGLAIIDLPASEFIPDLLSRPEWHDQKIMADIEAFCWILSPQVITDEKLQSFMKSMPHVKHIVASPDTCPNYLAMESSAASTIRLSRISKEHFPIPIHDNSALPQPSLQSGEPTSTVNLTGLDYHSAERGLKIKIEPNYAIDKEEVVQPLNTAKIIEDFPKKVQALVPRSPTNSLYGQESVKNSEQVVDPEIITLGTGSAVPSKYRNVSATLLRIPGMGNYLFDCGENTLGQLKRMYNHNEVIEVLKNLRFIWISHLHADHHLGTMSVLDAACEVKKQENVPGDNALISVIGEPAMLDFLHDLNIKSLRNVQHISCTPRSPLSLRNRSGRFFPGSQGTLAPLLDEMHVKTIDSTAVSHCNGAQAVSVTFKNGFKFSYSGDCRPSHWFTQIGADSDVLVHEATFDDGLEGDAMAKKHCTTAEALGVAAKMRAKNVILTHFSQRYQKIPVMNNVKKPEDIAFEEGAVVAGDVTPSVDPAVDLGPDESNSINSSAAVVAEVAANIVEAPSTAEEPSIEKTSETLWTPLNTRSLKHKSLSRSGSPSGPAHQMNVCVAFDCMRTRVSRIKDMHELYPAIEALFEVQHGKEGDDEELTEGQQNELANRKKVGGEGKGKRKKGEEKEAIGEGGVKKSPKMGKGKNLKGSNKKVGNFDGVEGEEKGILEVDMGVS